MGVVTVSKIPQILTLSAPFIAPNVDPNAMDIDSTHTWDEFLCHMKGRCFGCGSAVHTRCEENHNCKLCNYCKHTRHCESVCMDKFIGSKLKIQKAAATADEGSLSMSVDTPSREIANLDSDEGGSSVTLAAVMLNQLVE